MHTGETHCSTTHFHSGWLSYVHFYTSASRSYTSFLHMWFTRLYMLHLSHYVHIGCYTSHWSRDCAMVTVASLHWFTTYQWFHNVHFGLVICLLCHTHWSQLWISNCASLQSLHYGHCAVTTSIRISPSVSSSGCF